LACFTKKQPSPQESGGTPPGIPAPVSPPPEKFPWLKDINYQSLEQANRNLLTGFKNFFEGNGSYPTWKSKKDNHFSFQVPQNYQEKSFIVLRLMECRRRESL
jgi:transposase